MTNPVIKEGDSIVFIKIPGYGQCVTRKKDYNIYFDNEEGLFFIDDDGVERYEPLCNEDYKYEKVSFFDSTQQSDNRTVGVEEAVQSALNKQVSGSHYKDCAIQPIEYIHANNLNYFEGNAIKYITRHRKKNGKADLEKAIHYLELMLELEYGDK